MAAALSLGGCEACGLVQKDVAAPWPKVCERIYAEYSIYFQAAGREQKALGPDGVFAPRSTLLVDYLSRTLGPGARGAVLDIGCGNGAFLRTFQHAFGEWGVVGTELNSGFRDEIVAISPTARFLDGGELAASDERFDLVTLIHCLEHIPAPGAYLAELRKRLKPGATVMIQVPDGELNPFDFIIADHCSHFSKGCLERITAQAGYEVIACGNPVLGKEITLIARVAQAATPEAAPAPGTDYLERNLVWLDAIRTTATRLGGAGDLCVFGSSIAATWVGSLSARAPILYIDDDKDRVGGRLLGAPIVALEGVPEGATVFVPLAPHLARTIGERLRDSGVNAVFPS